MMPLGFVIFSYLIRLLNQISNKQDLFYYFSLGFFYGLGFLLVFLFWIQNPFLMNEATKNFEILGLMLPVFLSIVCTILYFINDLVICLHCYLTILLLSETNQAKPSTSVDPNLSTKQLTDKSSPLDQTSSVNEQPILQVYLSLFST